MGHEVPGEGPSDRHVLKVCSLARLIVSLFSNACVQWPQSQVHAGERSSGASQPCGADPPSSIPLARGMARVLWICFELTAFSFPPAFQVFKETLAQQSRRCKQLLKRASLCQRMQFDKMQGAAVAGSGGWRWPVVGGYRSFCAIAGEATLRIRNPESRSITAACVVTTTH